jgi:hypothetical protein
LCNPSSLSPPSHTTGVRYGGHGHGRQELRRTHQVCSYFTSHTHMSAIDYIMCVTYHNIT